MENIEKIIDTIEKCLRLSKSGNENEAIAAATKARILMDKYDVEVSLVEKLSKKDAGYSEIIFDTQRTTPWHRRLFYDLSKIYDVVGHTTTYIGARHKEYIAVGYKRDVKLFKQTYNYLGATIQRISLDALKGHKNRLKKEHLKPSRKNSLNFTHSFCSGMIYNICSRIDEQRREFLSKSVTARELVVCKKDNVQRWVDENMDLGTLRGIGGDINNSTFKKGYIAGNKVSLDEQIDAN